MNYLTSNLNGLNKAIPRVKAELANAGRRWRKSLLDRDRDAIEDWAVVLTEVEIARGALRRRLADECDTWFDNSAFAERRGATGER